MRDRDGTKLDRVQVWRLRCTNGLLAGDNDMEFYSVVLVMTMTTSDPFITSLSCFFYSSYYYLCEECLRGWVGFMLVHRCPCLTVSYDIWRTGHFDYYC